MRRALLPPLVQAGLLASLLGPGLACGEGVPRRPNLVLITIDTLRADRLGCYGHDRDTSPNLDRLAAEGVVFERAYAQAPWTLPSMASLMTSLYPTRHGAFARDRKLPEAAPVLAEVLRDAGYETAAVVSHLFVTGRYGFDRGFERFVETAVEESHHVASSPSVTKEALALLDGLDGGPFFLWAHYFDPHSDYLFHEKHDWAGDYAGPLSRDVLLRELRGDPELLSQADVDYLEARYDGEIAFTDRWIGKLLAELRERGLLEDTLVLVTADHGEQFLDHGDLGHGKYCWDEVARVPLILAGAVPAERKGTRSTALVETRDVAATLAELAGLREHPFEGASLLAPREPDALAVIEGSYANGTDERRRALVLGDWKLVRRLDAEGLELYDLRSDPGETTNLAGRDDERTRAALERLEGRLAAFGRDAALTGEDVPLSEEDLENLKHLGYGGNE